MSADRSSLKISFPRDFSGPATAAVISAVTDVLLTSYDVTFAKPGDKVDAENLKGPGKRYTVAPAPRKKS